MFYNAVIRSFMNSPSSGEGVQGRLLLSDLGEVPHSWIVRHQGKTLGRAADLSKIICGPQDPLQIIPIQSADVDVITVHVKTLKGTEFEVHLSRWLTVAYLKLKTAEKEGTPEHEQRLVLAGLELESGRALSDYNIENKAEVLLVSRMRGGGGFSCVDVQAKQLTGRGKAATYPWRGYTIGLNLYGFCPNRTCISNTNKNRPQVVVHAKYGVVQMSGKRSKFQCPACDVNQEGWFCPKNFVVSFARSLFRYKKSGVGQPVEEVLMESFGLNNEYKMFDDKGGAVKYDCIQIITVGTDSSPYRCMKCDSACIAPGDEPRSEFFLNCGHVYHLSCAPRNQDCLVCKAIMFGSIMDFTNTIQGFPRKLVPIERPVLQSRNMNDVSSEKGYLEISWDAYHSNAEILREKRKSKKNVQE